MANEQNGDLQMSDPQMNPLSDPKMAQVILV